ncbi:glycoprotein-N-acetylgalactosamine 3-beta-galactosyltransferase 1-like [Palaemon carinicauda]|uniref:glycoprotein-N-acetylgalactosamine 3-beta-galactosyltransferase 1-like n=1 Tax=Palaemon carinicauda TaxID=392227 RepID=UPI0035B665CC
MISVFLAGLITGRIIKEIKSKYDDLFDQFSHRHQFEDNRENPTRLLCLVLTTSQTREHALAVKNTWGKRCDKIIFSSDVEDKDLGSVSLKASYQNGDDVLWIKTKESFKYLFDHHLHDYDWFFKADVDTYVIVENLRYVLTPYNPKYPIALGERAHVDGNANNSFLSGGAGYVLSQGALKIFGEVIYPAANPCHRRTVSNEDVMMGVCMTRSGIMLGDTRDELGRHRFYHNKPEDYIDGKWQKWFPNMMRYRYDKGINSLSETSVSFHTFKNSSHLYFLERLIYETKVSSCD